MDASPITDLLRSAVPGASIDVLPSIDMPTIVVDREHILDVLTSLRDHADLQFSLLSDLTAVDRHPVEPRFEVVYHLACLGEAYATSHPAPARRLRLKVRLSGDDAMIASATSVYPSTNWLEREVYDLFGIGFEGHPDLRRILTPEDWTGHPLRKDYAVQIRKTAESWSPIQVTAEEFAANVRAQRSRATRELDDASRAREGSSTPGTK
jgi:NADH-quinone oxidoreductase subunit C